MKKSITYINILITLLISILVIYSIPSDIFLKYKLELIKKEKNDIKNNICFYSDLNNNSKLEKINFFLNKSSVGNVLIINNNKDLDLIWKPLGNNINFLDAIPLKINFINDYNKNNLNELYFLTIQKDSIFLNILEPKKEIKKSINKFNVEKKIPITKIFFKNDKPDVWLNNLNYYDINNDGFDEVVFTLSSGYSIQPRTIFYYDIKNNTLKRSPKTSINLIDLKFIKNKKIFLINRIGATGNTVSKNDIYKYKNALSQDSTDYYNKIKNKFIYKYGDFASYTLALDSNLNFLFPPIEHKGHQKYTSSIYIDNKIYSLINYPTDSSFIPFFEIVNYKGEIIKKHNIENLKKQYLVLKRINKNLIVQNLTNPQILVFDTLFKIIKTIKLNTHQEVQILDINNDKKEELVTIDDDNNLIIYDNFSNKIIFHINSCNNQKLHLSLFEINNERFFNANIGNTLYTFKYYKNNYFFLKYLFYSFIFIIIYLIVYFIYRLQKKQIQKKYEKEKELNELQLITIKNQINPHFIFNALNSISSVVYKEEKENAYNFITKFSSLIRATLLSSDKISRTLNEEIEFVSNYLDLEKFRFKEKFNFKIYIEENIDLTIQIPKMCIQTYVENSIKHGLMHKKTKGYLNIDVKKTDKYLEILIKDNGIGRKKAKETFSYSTGKGYIIMEKTYSLYKQLTNKEIKQIIRDLYDEKGNAQGTLVKILIEN